MVFIERSTKSLDLDKPWNNPRVVENPKQSRVKKIEKVWQQTRECRKNYEFISKFSIKMCITLETVWIVK